jgi:hypothetical protein
MIKKNTGKPRKLMDQVRDIMRRKHYSGKTEQNYLYWLKRYIFFHHKRHPRDLGVPEIEAFLTHLAVKEMVSASTQNQAFNAKYFCHQGGKKEKHSNCADSGGSFQVVNLNERHGAAYGATPVRQRPQSDGMCQAAGAEH